MSANSNLQQFVRVLVADDHQMWREALAGLLEGHPRIRVVGSSANPDEVLHLAVETAPHVIVTEVSVGGRSVFDFAETLIARVPTVRLLFVSAFLADAVVTQALRLNNASYILKGEPFETLCTAIERAAAGKRTLSPAVQERVIFDPAQQAYTVRHETELTGLTGRQLQVLRHLASGDSVKEIARVLHLSQKSVDSHKYRIMNKLGIHDRVKLARFAIREGLLSP